MVAEKQHMQEIGPESHEGILGDAVPRNGKDDQAARRAHMREQTTARQAAERNAERPAYEGRLDRSARIDGVHEREASLQNELTRINTEHQTWLRQGTPPDLPASAPESPPLTDPVAPE